MSKYIEQAKIFMAFCDETRLSVLKLLRNGEKCASVLLKQVNVGQSTLSHHMKILIESGMVTARKVGKWTFYSICEGGRQYVIDMLTWLSDYTAPEVVPSKA